MGGVPEFLAYVVISFIISSIAGAITRLLTGEPDIERTAGLRANTRDPSVKLPIVYGKLRIGGNDVFMETTGSQYKDMWIVQTLSEGECEGIAAEQDPEGEPGDSTEYDQVWLGDKAESEYGSNVQYWFHGGSHDQTYDTNLNSAIPKFNDNMQYVCYIVWKLIYDYDKFQNLPQRTVELKGRKLFDFRDNSTEWSDNPVLALYDFLTSTRYGYGFDSSKFDLVSWGAAATYCEIKGWTINMRVDRDINGHDVIDRICMLFRGELVWYSGKFYLRYADLNYETVSESLTDNDLLQNADGTAELSILQPGTFDIPDGLRVAFIDEEKGYVEDHIMVGDVSGVVKDVTLDGCTSRQQASNMGVYILERAKLDRVVSGTFRDNAIRLEPCDLTALTNETYGLLSQLMRVQSAGIRSDGLIDLTMAYEDIRLYDDNYDVDIEDTYECNLPDPTAEPPTISNVRVTEESYFYRLRNFTRIMIAFDEPADYPWFSHVEVWVRRGEEASDNTYEHQFNAASDFSIENVEEDEEYWIILRTVSIHGVKQSLDDGYSIRHVVTGYVDVPASCVELNAIVGPNTITLYSAKVTDPDIEVYEFRVGSTWAGGLFLAALRAPNLNLTGVKPGTHTFWVNTLSTNGRYGATPRSATVTLIDPPDSWVVQETFVCDYDESGDDHNNTEQTDYLGENYLKCSHGSGGLSGTYLSQIYDNGSSERFLAYVLADILVLGVGNTWDDVIPDNSIVATTWDDIGISTRTWYEIFEMVDAGRISITLKYGATSPPTSEIKMMEILSAIVIGRYFQVEITITDPSDPITSLVENFELKLCQQL